MGEEGEIVLETDELGQITWKEKVVYHMNSDKHKIKVERYLRAKDNKSKKAKITFYLYPYASNLNEETSEFFLNFTDLPVSSMIFDINNLTAFEPISIAAYFLIESILIFKLVYIIIINSDL